MYIGNVTYAYTKAKDQWNSGILKQTLPDKSFLDNSMQRWRNAHVFTTPIHMNYDDIATYQIKDPLKATKYFMEKLLTSRYLGGIFIDHVSNLNDDQDQLDSTHVVIMCDGFPTAYDMQIGSVSYITVHIAGTKMGML